MQIFRKYKIPIFIFAATVIAFFISRLYRIETLPIFTDEAIYTRWSQIARYDAGWRFISLTDGKQPMFVWFDMNFMRLIKDPLIAGRLVSVVAGLFSLIGLFFLGKEIFKNFWVGIISSFLYLIFPMALVYDRMALYDGLVGTFAIWSLYFEILLIRRMRLDLALLLGMIMGGGVLTKTIGFFSIYLLPFSLLLFDLKNKDKVSRFFKWLSLALITTVLTYGYYSVLRLSPFFHIINEKNSIFVYPIKEWITHPFNFFIGNFLGLWDWFITYATWPIIIFIVLAFVIQREFFREKLLLVVWFIIPFAALALFGKVLYPRFILFMILPLLPLAAFSIFNVYQKISLKPLVIVIFLLLIAGSIRSDYFIVNNIAKAPIPFSDLEQYINGWPAGGGVKEIIEFLRDQSTKGKIYVATQGTFGSLPTYSIEIYLGDDKNVEKRGIWPLPPEIPKDLTERAKKMPVYFVFNESEDPPPGWPLKFIARYQKGVGKRNISLYQVLPK